MVHDYFTLPMVLVLTGALLSGFGAALTTYRQNREKMKAALEQASFERELRGKSDQIAELNREIATILVGGDSFAYCAIGRPDDVRQECSIVLKNDGKYPVYDIRIRIVDKTLLSPPAMIEPSQDSTWAIQATKNVSIGTLGPNQTAPLDFALAFGKGFNLPHGDPQRKGQAYDITITARNGTVSQLVRLNYSGSTVSLATQLNHSGKIEEKAEPDFPRLKDGQIDWSVGLSKRP